MIAALLVLLSVYFAVRLLRRWNKSPDCSSPLDRAALMEFFQNMQNVYKKWEEKAEPKSASLFNNNTTMVSNGIVKEDVERRHSLEHSQLSSIDSGKVLSQRRANSVGGPVHNVPTASSQRSLRNRFRIPTLKLPQWDRLGQFKSSPAIISDFGPLRPVMGHCCARCVPTSRLAFHEDPSSLLGISNILSVPTQNRENGIIVRTFHHLAFLLKRNIGYLYPDISAKVLRCDRVIQAVDLAIEEEILDSDLDRSDLEPGQLEMLKKKHSKRAIEALVRMRSCISSILLRLAGWVLYKLLGRMLSGIHVQKGDLDNLRKVSKRNLPIIYLPLHRSHLDYILVTFILYISDLKAPVIAAGDNLLIPFFGALMRGLGAFFIKRKLDTKSGKKDHVYRAILHSYMSECLKANHSLEFFIEGGRSRTGKACMPKGGLLSVVVDSVLEGTVEDAYIVPVGISYEKILDGNFVPEQLGKPKTMESFKSAVTAIWSTLHSNFGNVRVDFCQPFSIKEFLQAAKRRHPGIVPILKPIPSSLQPVRRKSSNSSLYGLDIVTEDNREIVRDLAKHIIYDAANCTAVMSTNMLSFLLLTKHRKGATLQQLIQSMNWLKEELSSRQRDIGFTGETSDIIKHAWTLLGKDLVTTETIQMEWSSLETEAGNVKITFYKPVIILPYVLELQYYANSIVSAFLMESVVVNAIFAELDEDLEPWRGCKSQVFVSCSGIVQKCLDLCDILQYEFIFAPPCADTSSVIIDTIERLVTSELLTPLDADSSNIKRAWANRPMDSNDWGSSDEEDGLHQSRDQKFKVSLSEESLNKLQFLRCILSPLIESYWVSACSLVKLVHIQKEESLFFREIQKTAEERLHKGLLTYEESFAAEPLKNSLKLFEQWNVLENHVQDSVRLLYLRTEYDNEDRLQEVVSRIENFRK